MLDDKDIQKLIEVFATKDEMKEMISTLPTKEDFHILQTAVDVYAHKADAYFQEMVMFSHQIKRHEKWIQQLADKLGVKLDY